MGYPWVYYERLGKSSELTPSWACTIWKEHIDELEKSCFRYDRSIGMGALLFIAMWVASSSFLDKNSMFTLVFYLYGGFMLVLFWWLAHAIFDERREYRKRLKAAKAHLAYWEARTRSDA